MRRVFPTALLCCPHQPLDLAVVIAYALAMVAFGLYFYFRVERYSDYYDGTHH
jgi:hypothetical protein